MRNNRYSQLQKKNAWGQLCPNDIAGGGLRVQFLLLLDLLSDCSPFSIDWFQKCSILLFTVSDFKFLDKKNEKILPVVWTDDFENNRNERISRISSPPPPKKTNNFKTSIVEVVELFSEYVCSRRVLQQKSSVQSNASCVIHAWSHFVIYFEKNSSPIAA